MEYFGVRLTTNLEVRSIKRDEDIDLFILTLGYPIDLEVQGSHFSRIQFPNSEALILRISPKSTCVTCHVLKDTDLFSSFANFEVNLEDQEILINKNNGYIALRFK